MKENRIIFENKALDLTIKFKCTKSYVDLYIGKCDTNDVGDHIVSYIKRNLNIDINKIEELKCRNPSSKSFKLNIEVRASEKLLAEDK